MPAKTRKQLIQEFADKHLNLDCVFLENARPPRKYQTCLVCWNDRHKEFYGFYIIGHDEPLVKVAVTAEDFEKFKAQKRERQRQIAGAFSDPKIAYIGRECGKAVKIAIKKKKQETEKRHCVVIEDDL